MKQRNEMNCGFFTNLFQTQEKWFLTKKKELEETQPPSNSRRTKKSTDLKNEAQLKPQKKSLKKRAKSNVSSNTLLVGGEVGQTNKIQSQMKMVFESNNFNSHPQFSFSRTVQAPFARQTFSPSVFKNQQHPQINTSYINKIHPTQLANCPQMAPTHYRTHQHIITTNAIKAQNQNHYEQTFHQSPEHRQAKHQVKHEAKHQYGSNKIGYGQAKEETPLNLVPKIHHPTKYTEQETESWIPVREDSLIIQEFNRLFKNKEEHQSHQNLNQDNKPHLRAREAKKSKRLEKQQEFGRYAESDDDEVCSEAASQVIGRGFESHFQRCYDFDQANHVEETMATRSTNTKISQLNKKDVSQQSYKPKFGEKQFKSYKYP